MHQNSHRPLAGKTALVTGAARRLGRASALALAKAGADVAITFRNSASDAQKTVVDLSGMGVRAFALRCDVTDEVSVRAMMKEAGLELSPSQNQVSSPPSPDGGVSNPHNLDSSQLFNAS